MSRILHLLVREDDGFAAQVMATQKAEGHEVITVNLTVAEPDYRGIVEHIFAAESVEVW